jgi:hypothetical protein
MEFQAPEGNTISGRLFCTRRTPVRHHKHRQEKNPGTAQSRLDGAAIDFKMTTGVPKGLVPLDLLRKFYQ